MKTKQLQHSKQIYGYSLNSFLTTKLESDFFDLDLKRLNDSKFQFTSDEIDRFLFEIKRDAFNTMFDQIESSQKRQYNRVTSYSDTPHQPARMRAIQRYIETKNLFSNFFSFYLEQNIKSDQPTVHKQLTVELLEKMMWSLEYFNSSQFIKSSVELIKRLEDKEIFIQIKDIISLKESRDFKDLMFISLDLDLPPDSSVFDEAFISGFNKKKVENIINNMSPTDRFHYSQACKLDNKLEFETKRSLKLDANKKVIFFLDKFFFINKRSY
jgi:hypothetical protein